MIEAIVGVTLVLLSLTAAMALIVYMQKGMQAVHASTEWRLMNAKIDAFLGDTLTCERTNLVLGAAPFIADPALVPDPDHVKVMDFTTIEFYQDPSDLT